MTVITACNFVRVVAHKTRTWCTHIHILLASMLIRIEIHGGVFHVRRRTYLLIIYNTDPHSLDGSSSMIRELCDGHEKKSGLILASLPLAHGLGNSKRVFFPARPRARPLLHNASHIICTWYFVSLTPFPSFPTDRSNDPVKFQRLYLYSKASL